MRLKRSNEENIYETHRKFTFVVEDALLKARSPEKWSEFRNDLSDLGTDIQNTLSVMGYRDYTRGLRLVGKWRKALTELSYTHQIELIKREREAVLAPIISNSKQIGLRFSMIANDSVGVVIRLYGHNPFFIVLETPVSALGIIHIKLLKAESIKSSNSVKDQDESTTNTDKIIQEFEAVFYELSNMFFGAEIANHNMDGSPEEIDKIIQKEYDGAFSELWDSTFGAKIVANYDLDGSLCEDYVGLTLHDFLQTTGANKLKVIPQAFLYSLSLQAACREVDGKLRYAVEDYDIRYLTPWKLTPSTTKKSTVEKYIDSLFFSDIEPGENELKYAMPEIDLKILSLKSTGKRWATLAKNGWAVSDDIHIADEDVISQIKSLMNQSKQIYFTTHGDDYFGGHSISIYDGSKRYRLTPEDLASLDLLDDCYVFLNSCYSSSSHPGTDFEDHTLPVSLIASNAKNVVATTLPVDDSEAFRIGLSVWNYVEKNMISITDALRKVCIESIKGELPYYYNELKNIGYRELSKNLKYKDVTGNSYVRSWVSYIIWEQHDEQ